MCECESACVRVCLSVCLSVSVSVRARARTCVCVCATRLKYALPEQTSKSMVVCTERQETKTVEHLFP